MAETSTPSERGEFNLEESLVEIQRLTAQAHEVYAKRNKGGERQYEILMDLRSMAGEVEFDPITKDELPDTLKRIDELTEQIKPNVDEENPLFKTLVQLKTDLNEANDVFGVSNEKDGVKKGLSRRDFLKAAGIAITAGTIHAIDTQRMGHVDARALQDNSEFAQDIQFLNEKYGLEIYRGLPLSAAIAVNYEQPNVEEIHQAVRHVREAVENYPDNFFRNIGLSNVALVKDLKYATGDRFGGVMHQLSGVLTVTIEYGEDDFKHVFNHETYHAGDLGSNLLYYLRNAAHEDLSTLSGKIIKINNEEEAWLASTMLTSDGYRNIQNRIASGVDVVSDLDKKVKQIKTNYSRWTEGKMNDQYWQDMQDGKVDENYWK